MLKQREIENKEYAVNDVLYIRVSKSLVTKLDKHGLSYDAGDCIVAKINKISKTESRGTYYNVICYPEYKEVYDDSFLDKPLLDHKGKAKGFLVNGHTIRTASYLGTDGDVGTPDEPVYEKGGNIKLDELDAAEPDDLKPKVEVSEEALAAGFVGTMAKMVSKSIQPAIEEMFASKEQQILSRVDEAVKAKSRKLEVKVKDESVKFDIAHKSLAGLLMAVSIKKPVMMVGAAGSGKTTACEQVAEAFNLQFYPMSVGRQTSKSDLLGYMNATGGYVKSIVRMAFEDGGLLLLDELDAANENTLTILNALLENGYASFPDGVIKKHDDFLVVGAANTFGRGADRVYVGRTQQDGASLDRFVTFNFDYDEEMERTIAGNDDWCDRVQRYRHNAEKLSSRVVISPRASIRGAMLLDAGFTTTEVEEMVIWKGIPKDQKSKIKAGC